MKEKEILDRLNVKLGISELNEMQKKMLQAASEKRDIILLSPTGSGKTVAFIVPVIKMLKPSSGRIQVVVVAPSRELVIQIAEIFNNLAADYKVTALYGGHKVEDEVNSLKVVPDVVVATPGRLLDHMKRENLDVLPVRILVLDEFDKILELGFEDELKKILKRLKNVSRNILTSATDADVLPDFLKLENPVELDFVTRNRSVRKRLRINRVNSDSKDKLASLSSLLKTLSSEDNPEKMIVFVNYRESADRVYEYLKSRDISCALYHGALDQKDRELALACFNNGSRPVLVATDLAARGLDIDNVKNIIHYHQALTPEAYTHRNGRTARVDKEGDVYILIGPEEDIKEFSDFDREIWLDEESKGNLMSPLTSIYISGGKKEKISKGDIMGFLIKECGLDASQVGKINVFDHYSVVAVARETAKNVIRESEIKKLKGAKYKFRKI